MSGNCESGPLCRGDLFRDAQRYTYTHYSLFKSKNNKNEALSATLPFVSIHFSLANNPGHIYCTLNDKFH